MYINYASDILVTRGNWNVVSFADFYNRVSKNGLAHLAIDTEGCFWRENLKDYCTHGNWPLTSLKELMLYDSRGDKIWKGSDYIDKFRQRHKGGPKLLELEELDGETSEDVRDVEEYLLKTFDKIEGKEETIEKVDEGQEAAPAPQRRKPRYLDDCPLTKPEELRRPNITVKKLVAKSIG